MQLVRAHFGFFAIVRWFADSFKLKIVLPNARRRQLSIQLQAEVPIMRWILSLFFGLLPIHTGCRGSATAAYVVTPGKNLRVLFIGNSLTHEQQSAAHSSGTSRCGRSARASSEIGPIAWHKS